MIADRQTLRDLEIFECRDGRASVFDLLDRARTPGGRQKLKERFRSPLADAASIVAVQDALRFVLAHPDAFRDWPRVADGERVAALDAYLHSRYGTSRARGTLLLWADGIWHRLRWRAVLEEAHLGVNRVAAWLVDAAELCADVQAAEPPAVLAAPIQRLADGLASARVAALRERGEVGSASVGTVLRLDREIRDHLRPALLALLDAAHEVDALVAMAVATRELGLAFPEVVGPGERGEARLEIRGVWHPFLHGARPNDLHPGDCETLTFLTGPNMAGKTTYLKSCGVAVYLAHLGMGVPAAAMRLAPFDRLFTGINTEDSVRLGYSYFFSEVRRVREAAELLSAGARSFVLFDEMFKGTNVKDACDATLRVCAGLARARGSVFLVSSHLVELVDELRTVPGVGFACFEAEMGEDGPVYSYALKPGASAQRLGLVLLEREGVLDALERVASPPSPST